MRIGWAQQVAQSVKHVLHAEELEFNAQNPCKNARHVYTYNPSTGETDTRGPLKHASQLV